MSFKDARAADVSRIFFALSDFAETREINGRCMRVVPDTDALVDWKDGTHTGGLYASDQLIRVMACEFGPRPKQGSRVVMDGENWQVVDVDDSEGVYAIRLRRARM